MTHGLLIRADITFVTPGEPSLVGELALAAIETFGCPDRVRVPAEQAARTFGPTGVGRVLAGGTVGAHGSLIGDCKGARGTMRAHGPALQVLKRSRRTAHAVGMHRRAAQEAVGCPVMEEADDLLVGQGINRMAGQPCHGVVFRQC